MQRNAGRVSPYAGYLLAAVVFVGTASAQDQRRPADSNPGGGFDRGRGGVAVQGRVELDDGSSPTRTDLSIRLVPMGGGMMGGLRDGEAMVSLEGTFNFMSVIPGSYRLQVVDNAGNVLHTQFVEVQDGGILEVRMHRPKVERPVSGTISLARLQHKVPGKAQKEFRKAMEADKNKQSEKAIEHLAKAVEIDPEFVQALTLLGMHHLRAARYDDSIAQFRKALGVDPDYAPANTNLAIALYATRHFTDAEQAARRAVKSDPMADQASLVLAMSLMAEKRPDDEALRAFTVASRQFPRARLGAAEILASRGERDKAADELRKFLPAATAEERAKVEAWLQQLTQAD